VMQTAAPEAMVLTAGASKRYLSDLPPLGAYDAIGIGPGMGQREETARALGALLEKSPVPMVIDADALNIISEHPAWPARVPKGSVLTPHLKEFERLTGPADNHFARLRALREFAREHAVHLVLKGAHSAVATPEGDIHFNGTGNPGMATGGSGDVLTGILTALLAQAYGPAAARLGAYVHGLAGDLAAARVGETALIASDLIDHLGAAFEGIRAASGR
ncbi:MAG: NAD(P)H-hydrate dehydratase, partial [Catalinimonas sp.]